MSDIPGTRIVDERYEIAVTGLTPAEQFVLGVCRCWDAFAERGDPALAWRELTPVFLYMNVGAAMCAFERVFALLYTHRRSPLRFHEVDCTRLASHEARLLCALASLQRGAARAALAVLNRPMSLPEARCLLIPLARIAAILDLQGHRLPAWSVAEPTPTGRKAQAGAADWLAGRNFLTAAIPSAMNTISTIP